MRRQKTVPYPLKLDELLDIFPDHLSRYTVLLERYLNGEDITPLTVDGYRELEALSPFTRNVLQGVCDVRFGEIVTYRQLAEKLGCPEAVRAVGSALGRNPLPVIFPCHRVVASHGLGGYAFGSDLKRKLLDFESTTL